MSSKSRRYVAVAIASAQSKKIEGPKILAIQDLYIYLFTFYSPFGRYVAAAIASASLPPFILPIKRRQSANCY